MKITRYYQSCILIEDGGVRVLIDPSGHEAERYESFGKLDGVIYTHEHGDHFDPDLAEKFALAGVPRYANAATAEKMKSAPNMIIEDAQEFDINSLSVKAYELPHCLMVNGSAGPQNTGYLIGGKLFHAGDGVNLAGLEVEVLAAPITGPDISLKDVSDFAKQVGAKKVIPIHYDLIGTKPEILERLAGSPPFEIRIIPLAESAEV